MVGFQIRALEQALHLLQHQRLRALSPQGDLALRVGDGDGITAQQERMKAKQLMIVPISMPCVPGGS